MTMTEQDIYDNYEFKVLERALRREFPFIKKVYVKDPDDVDRYDTMQFLDVDINPYEMVQQYGLRIDPIADRYLRRGEPYWGPYLSMFVKGSVDEARPITDAINELILGVRNSPALPPQLKYPKKFDMSRWHATPDTVPSDIMSGMDSY
jgi:hypothetical protein